MRFYKILFSFVLLFLMSCRHDPVPDNLIDEDEFVQLLVDVHLADGYLNSKPQTPDSLSYYGNGLYSAVFKKHHVDSVQFKKSYQYYSVQLEQMNRIYKAVVGKLTAKQDSINKYLAAEEMKKNRRTADSIAKAAKIIATKKATKQDSIKKVLKPTTK